MRVAIIGATGFVGRALVAQFETAGHDVSAVGRQNYEALKGDYDLVVNSSNNSKKYISDRDPVLDLEISVANQLRVIHDYPAETHVLISSVDVYESLDSRDSTREDQGINPEDASNYGLHKHFAEQLVRHYCPNWLIIRLAGMVGPGLIKNPVFDILNDQPLRIHPESQYQFMNTADVARIVRELVERGHRKDVLNLCAEGLVSPSQIAELAGKTINLEQLDPNVRPRIVDISTEKLAKLFDLPSSFETVKSFIAAELK